MIRFTPPQPSLEQLIKRAASGSPGSIAARRQLQERRHEQLRQEVQQGRGAGLTNNQQSGATQ